MNETDCPGKRNPESNHDFEAHVVLLEPEIPQNTGNIARTCMALDCPLHLIKPLGFSIGDKHLKRAGMDYWQQVDVRTYENLQQFYQMNPEGQFYYFSKKMKRYYHEPQFRGTCYFIFGKESWGLPEPLIEANRSQAFRIPMRRDARSLNLSNSVAVVLFEAFRQNGFPGVFV